MKLTIEISENQLTSVICSAMEGGIYYWARDADSSDIAVPKCLGIDSSLDDYAQPLLDKGWYKVWERETGKPCVLNRDNIERAICIIAEKYPHHLGAICGSNDQDAITGDVLVQCAIFGELKYG